MNYSKLPGHTTLQTLVLYQPPPLPSQRSFSILLFKLIFTPFSSDLQKVKEEEKIMRLGNLRINNFR